MVGTSNKSVPEDLPLNIPSWRTPEEKGWIYLFFFVVIGIHGGWNDGDGITLSNFLKSVGFSGDVIFSDFSPCTF